MADARQAAIADHGLIGDLRTAALVATDGTIDWFCPGRFDAPSVFASVLDPGAGSWRLAPDDPEARSQQYYHPETNILVTRFMTDHGVVEVQDFMPVMRAHDPGHRQRLVRRVVALRGSVDLTMTMEPRPDYGATDPRLDVRGDVVCFTDGDVRLALSSTEDLEVTDHRASARLALEAGSAALFVLEVLGPEQEPTGSTEADVDELFEATASFWRTWLAQSTYTGRWREWVDRSALTLKLLCHEPSGGIVAAPTTSLPERIGGSRNWDYRFVWVRDAAFSVYALLRLGFTDEASAFVRFLSERLGETDEEGGTGDRDLGPLRVLYDLDGRVPHEQELDHLAGHRGSRPVRVGNGAVDQLQLDVYGELIDSVYLFDKHGNGISHDAWTDLRRIVSWLGENWERPDAGMWETRSDPRTHTTSLVMCWVAVERMMRVARRRGLPSDLTELAATRDAIYERVMTDCWDEDLGSFTASPGSEALDAGLLLMPMVKMLAPDDPRFLGTLARIEERLVTDSLVLRYDPEAFDDGVEPEDDRPQAEGTFSLCSFWYVEALTRAGRHAEARLALEKMFTYANHLGQYAEQVGLNGEQLGNFPQAFTHLSLVSAVINLDRSLSG